MLILLSLVGAYAAVGLLFIQADPTVLALLFNCFLFYLLSFKEFKPSQKKIKIVLSIYLFFFYLQFAYSYVTGGIVSYHALTDIAPRLESSIFRPPGLFYEPAIYCLATFMLTTMLVPRRSKNSLIESLAVASMVISVSLLGLVFAAFVLIRQVSNRKYATLILCAFSIIVADNEPIKTMLTFAQNRLSDLVSDASANCRYGNIIDLFSDTNLVFRLIGRGFGASFEQFGSSGASAAISAVGILGLALLSVWLLLRSREFQLGCWHYSLS